MIDKPQLKTFLTMFPVSATEWGVRGGPEEVWKLRLPNDGVVQAFCTLLPFLDGARTRDEIAAAAVGRGVETGLSLKLLDRLESSGLLEDASVNGLSDHERREFAGQLSFFSRFTSSGGAVYQTRLKQSRVAVIGSGELGDCVCRRLKETGVGDVILVSLGRSPADAQDLVSEHDISVIEGTADGLWPDSLTPYPSLFVVAEDRFVPSALETMDRFAKRHSIPWLLVRGTDVHEVCVGPLFIPGETASYVSLDARLRSNAVHYDQYVAFDRHVREHPEQARLAGGLRPVYEILSGIAVVEVVKFLSGVLLPTLIGRMLTLNIVTWESELHDVLKVPRLERGFETPHEAFPWKDSSHVYR